MIYILEFEKPLGNPAEPRGQARYYVGYCEDNRLEERLEEHKSGYGAAITRALAQRNIGFKVVLTLPGDRSVERRIKRRKNTPRFVRNYLKKVRTS